VGYVLGEAHALRVACEGKGASVARGLDAAGAGSPTRLRRALRDSFNAGFSYREAAHPSCDADARAAYATPRTGRSAAARCRPASRAAAARRSSRVASPCRDRGRGPEMELIVR
jgi:predicted secreted protein